MDDDVSDRPPQAVLDHRDLVGFLSALRGSSRWGCQAQGAENSDEGFSLIRIRVQDPTTGRWQKRELRAEQHEGVPRITYTATEDDSDEATRDTA